MLRRLALSALLFAGVCRLVSAEPKNLLAAAIVATPEHPRNSEGAFVTLKSGRILFAYSQFIGGTSDYSPCQIAQVTSDDEGKTWSAPTVMFTAPANALEMSVSMLRLKSGQIAFFSAIKPNQSECLPYVRYSSDEGATWTAPRRMIDAPGYYVLNNDRIIQLRDGRLIMPMGFHRGITAPVGSEHMVDLRAIAIWFYSDDEGKTWKESPTWWTIPVASETGLQEPGAVELADGSLFAWARTDQGAQYSFRSTDRGLTWSAPRLTDLRSPASPASIKRLPDSSDLVVVLNDHSGQFPFKFTPRTYAGRTPLSASISSDGGETWRPAKLLENETYRDYCYTAIHFTRDSVLFAYLAYSQDHSRPGELRIRRLDRAWLTAPDDALVKKSKAVLHDILDHDETWIKIHAAEALIVGGEAIEIRRRFLAMAPTAADHVYRIGIWRVLANTSPTAKDRAACVAEVEKVFTNPASKDRSQALETLCKLGVHLKGEALEQVRALARDPSAPLHGLSWWAMRLADEPGAREGLLALIRSPQEESRVIGGYALRWVRDTDPTVLQALAEAAAKEPATTRAYAYLHSASTALAADPASAAANRVALDGILAKGNMEGRFEASNGLLKLATLDRVPLYAPLLDDPEADTRVGAALSILYVHARE